MFGAYYKRLVIVPRQLQIRLAPDKLTSISTRLRRLLLAMTTLQPVYEVRPRKDWRGFDLVGHRVPLGRLQFEGPDAIVDAVIYAKFYSSSHPAIIRVFDESGAVIGAHQSTGDFR